MRGAQEGILLGLMMLMSREDLGTGQISGEGLFLLALVSAVNGLTDGMVDMLGWMSFLPGFFLCLISLASGGKIGMGDGYLFWALGFCLHPLAVFRILMDSFSLAGMYALGIGILKYTKRLPKDSYEEGFPMVPFITAAAGGVWLPTLRFF